RGGAGRASASGSSPSPGRPVSASDAPEPAETAGHGFRSADASADDGHVVGSGQLSRFAQIAGAAVSGAVLLLGGALSPAQARSAAASGAAAPGSYRQNDFSADPGWEGQRNHSNSRCAKRSFSFGWSGTTLASSTPGEIGGKIERSSLYRAYYAERLPAVRSLDDSLTVTGTIRVPKPNGGGALL